MSSAGRSGSVPPVDTALLHPAPRRGRLATTLRAGVVGATIGTLVLNGSQTVFGSLATVTLTNVLGPRGFGAYSFAFTWATLLTIPSVLGMTPLVVRYVATYRERSAWGHVRGIVRRTNQVVGLSSIVVASIAAAIGWLALSGSDLLAPFLAGMLLVPLISLITMRQAVMSGLGQVVFGRLPDTVVGPGVMLALLLGFAALTGGHYSAAAAMGMQVAAVALAFWLGTWMLRRVLPAQTRVAEPAYETRAWVRGGLALLLASVAVALSLQVGTLVVGIIKGSAATGVFAASIRVATFASFLYVATSYPLMPAMARLHAQGASADLEQLAVRAARAVTLVSLPLLALVLVGAPTVLGILGAGFGTGVTALRILLVGEIVRQITGFHGTVLLMTGHERAFAWVTVTSTLVNLTLCVALVPGLGVNGAAIGTTTAVVIQSLGLLLVTRRQTGIWTAAIPLPGRRRRMAT
jgi:O-antigen/teichoic acid export membrane protein